MKQELRVADLQKAAEENLQRDGFLTPIVFICSEKGASAVNAIEYMESDERKDELIRNVSVAAQQLNAYKIIMISEGWMYETEGIPDEELDKLCASDAYRKKLPRSEVYQIMEITGASVTMLCRKFARTEDDTIVLGETMEISDGSYNGRFISWQNCLRSLN